MKIEPQPQVWEDRNDFGMEEEIEAAEANYNDERLRWHFNSEKAAQLVEVKVTIG